MSLPSRVVEAAIRGFTCAYAGYTSTPLRLGELVAVREGPGSVFGVVADVASGPEDPSRPLQPRGSAAETAADVLAANPEIELLLRTRLTVVTCGHIEGEAIRPHLPPTPPPLLAQVGAATSDETVRLAAGGAFLAPLVAAPACDDAVLAATIRLAARAFGPRSHEFTVEAGKELARLLKAEPSRLTSILRGAAQ